MARQTQTVLSEAGGRAGSTRRALALVLRDPDAEAQVPTSPRGARGQWQRTQEGGAWERLVSPLGCLFLPGGSKDNLLPFESGRAPRGPVLPGVGIQSMICDFCILPKGMTAPLEVSLGHWLCPGDHVCPERSSLLPPDLQ